MIKALSVFLLLILVSSLSCIIINPGGGTGEGPDIKYFVIEPAVISPGQQAVLVWEVTNASTIYLEPDFGTVDSIGKIPLNPTSTTTYKMTATNGRGVSRQSVTLVVSSATVAPPIAGDRPTIVTFSASPSSVSSGGTAILNWDVSNSTAVRISGIGDVAASGTSVVYPSTTTTYVIEAQNSSGYSSSSATITVGSTSPPSSPGFPVISSFIANPSSISAGSASELSWNISNAASVTLNPGFGTVAPISSILVYPSATTTYTLTAQNSSGTRIATSTVTVTGGASPSVTPSIISFSAVPARITEGQYSTLQWTASDAVRFRITEPLFGFDMETYGNSIQVHPVVSSMVTRGADLVYCLTAISASGATTEAYARLTVDVPAAATPVISSFSAVPDRITEGQYSTLQWTASDAVRYRITEPLFGFDMETYGNSIQVHPVVSSMVTRGADLVYCLTAISASGATTEAYARLTVDVAPTFPPATIPVINQFYSDPYLINEGEASYLHWSVSDATSVSIDNGVGTVALTGQKKVFPTATTTYTITATGTGGSITSSTLVKIYRP